MIANLKAVLGLDSMPYKTGARGVKQENRSLQQSFAKIGAAIGVSFGIAAIVRAGRALVDYASQASIAARNVGMLTSEMIALNRVGMTAGMQTRQMEQLMSRLSTELFEAARGSETAEKKFTDMGLAVDDLIRMDPAQQLQAIARAAFESGVPVGHLADLFGQRLGPQAMTALRQIAEQGLPAVDAAVGRTADSLEAMGSKWAIISDQAKGFALSVVSAINTAHTAVTGFVGGVLGEWIILMDRVTDLDFRGAHKQMKVVASPHEMIKAGIDEANRRLESDQRRIDEIAQRREREREQSREQMQALRGGSVEEREGAAAEKSHRRIATTEEAERAANERIIRQRMDGEDRIRADYLAAHADAVRLWENAESEALKSIYLDRIELMNQYYREDAMAHREAEREKLQAEAQRQQTAIERLQDRLQSEQARTQGVGVAADALARVGGFMGGERAGMAVDDKKRQLKAIEETSETNRQMLELMRQQEMHQATVTGGGM